MLSGCSKKDLNASPSPITLRISEPTIYSFTINNPSYNVNSNYSNFQFSFPPSDKVVIGNVDVNRNYLRDGETATVSMLMTSLSVEKLYVISGQLKYYDGYKEIIIPIEIRSNTPQLGNENSIKLELKEAGWDGLVSATFGKPLTLHVIIRKNKDDLYPNGKIVITSDYVNFDCVSGYECDKESDGKISVTNQISKDASIPFIITVNKPSGATTEHSFTFDVELLYSKDGSSDWSSITKNSFAIKANV